SYIDNSTVAQFLFAGDLNIPKGSIVIGTGGHGISLYSLDNVNVGSNVVFDMEGMPSGQAGPGGGTGGSPGGTGSAGGGGGGGGSFNSSVGGGGGGGGAFN